MKYRDLYNKIFDNINFEEYIIYGENINNGSYIGGLANNLQKYGKNVVNVANAEYTHIGMGYGIALAGKKALYICKQFDFMLFGMDHFISTHEIFKLSLSQGNFIMVCPVQDQGYQGPQSSFTKITEFSNLIDFPIFILNSLSSYRAFEHAISQPGILMGLLSQALLNVNLPELDLEYKNYQGYEVYGRFSGGKQKYRFYTNGFSLHYLKTYLLENNIDLSDILIVNRYSNFVNFFKINDEYNFNFIIDDCCTDNFYPHNIKSIVNIDNKINSVKSNNFDQVIRDSLQDIFKN